MVNNTNVREVRAITDDELEALARCLYPTVSAFFESDEGKREFAQWQSRESTEGVPGGMAELVHGYRLAG